MAHASNILGHLYDIELVSLIVKSIIKIFTLLWMESEPYHIDLRDLRKIGMDLYVASCHKWFGPHLGVLCGKTRSIEALACQNAVSDFIEFKKWEHGMINVEACDVVEGMWR